jgi:hypothetical protein
MERLAAAIFMVVKFAEYSGKYLLENICTYVTIYTAS